MRIAELEKTDAVLNVLEFFDGLPPKIQVKIIIAGLLVVADNFLCEERTELIKFLRAYINN